MGIDAATIPIRPQRMIRPLTAIQVLHKARTEGFIVEPQLPHPASCEDVMQRRVIAVERMLGRVDTA